MAGSPIAKPGRWESTVQIEMPNMPVKIPPQTTTRCVTKEQAENAENLIPKTGEKRGGCTYSDVKVEGSTMSWKMTCEKSGMTGSGTTTYHGDTYEGSMQLKINDQEMSARMTGKFLGECDVREVARQAVRLTNRQDVVAKCQFVKNGDASSEEEARAVTVDLGGDVFYILSDTSRTAESKDSGSTTTYNYEVRRLTGEIYRCAAKAP
jgi:hypothetical protein